VRSREGETLWKKSRLDGEKGDSLYERLFLSFNPKCEKKRARRAIFLKIGRLPEVGGSTRPSSEIVEKSALEKKLRVGKKFARFV